MTLCAELQRNRPVENKICRASQSDIAKAPVSRFESNFESISSANFHFDWGRRAVPHAVKQRGRTNACAAGEGLCLHATFIGANGDGLRSEHLNKIGIRSSRRKSRVVTKGRSIFDHINRRDIFRKDDSVGNSGI